MFYANMAKAQAGSAESQANLVLNDIMLIEIAQPTVNVSMSQVGHYLYGNSSPLEENHIQITSTSSYVVTVKAVSSNFTLDGASTTLPVSTIEVQTAVGDDIANTNYAAGNTTTTSPVVLGSTGQSVINSNLGELKQGYDVAYHIPPSVTSEFLNRAPGNYSTTIIYTVLPQ